MQVEVTILGDNPRGQMPKYMTEGASGLDLCACTKDDIVIMPGKRCVIPTGLAMAIPQNWEGQVRPRSGLAARHGVTVLNAPGTIDSDYRGEISVILINHGEQPFTVRNGDRIAQLVICPVNRVELVEVQSLDHTLRGEGGFGHTGR